ncbi:hypothetical protein F8M41_016785 [Gigaspora margarita]|uniref:Uncharacterized protein n=1 Tax=Gigaspora margarita TaxID=4874 RepID=A0A8H4EUF2_GIGMA|nr:hypothetical protein F8M41_016785 [Gigaspora margarita]
MIEKTKLPDTPVFYNQLQPRPCQDHFKKTEIEDVCFDFDVLNVGTSVASPKSHAKKPALSPYVQVTMPVKRKIPPSVLSVTSAPHALLTELLNKKGPVTEILDVYFTLEEPLKGDDETNELKRDGSGVENDTTYDLKDANEVVDSETLVDNREEDDKQLNDGFDKVLKKEGLECACEVWAKKVREF